MTQTAEKPYPKAARTYTAHITGYSPGDSCLSSPVKDPQITLNSLQSLRWLSG